MNKKTSQRQTKDINIYDEQYNVYFNLHFYYTLKLPGNTIVFFTKYDYFSQNLIKKPFKEKNLDFTTQALIIIMEILYTKLSEGAVRE